MLISVGFPYMRQSGTSIGPIHPELRRSTLRSDKPKLGTSTKDVSGTLFPWESCREESAYNHIWGSSAQTHFHLTTVCLTIESFLF